jgi:hypothetical protein
MSKKTAKAKAKTNQVNQSNEKSKELTTIDILGGERYRILKQFVTSTYYELIKDLPVFSTDTYLALESFKDAVNSNTTPTLSPRYNRRLIELASKLISEGLTARNIKHVHYMPTKEHPLPTYDDLFSVEMQKFVKKMRYKERGYMLHRLVNQELLKQDLYLELGLPTYRLPVWNEVHISQAMLEAFDNKATTPHDPTILKLHFDGNRKEYTRYRKHYELLKGFLEIPENNTLFNQLVDESACIARSTTED